MADSKLPRIALVWPHFINYHTDRCSAAARRLDGRAEVLAVEVATAWSDYEAFPRSEVAGDARIRTLFVGRPFDAVPAWRRFAATFAAVRSCRIVCLGVPYSHPEFVVLAWLLRLLGKQVVMMCDSKFDDRPRRAWFEFLKGLGLSGFSAALVAGSRGRDYFRFLGFRRRPILFGYDTIATERIRAEAASHEDDAALEFAARDFVFAGRFIEEKNLFVLIEAFAQYCRREGGNRRLVLVGSGPQEEALRQEAEAKVPAGRVVFSGFLSGSALSATMARALGLVLVSHSETWGLVVNEALALGVPVIVSEAPGARDILVRNGSNGLVVETGSTESLVRAMQRLGADHAEWQAMSQAANDRAWLGDVENFADSIELLFDPAAQPAGQRADAYCAEFAPELAL